MTKRVWMLLIAIFVLVASQAVLMVGILLGGAAAGAVGMIAIVGGLIGIFAGIIMGLTSILTSSRAGALED